MFLLPCSSQPLFYSSLPNANASAVDLTLIKRAPLLSLGQRGLVSPHVIKKSTSVTVTPLSAVCSRTSPYMYNVFFCPLSPFPDQRGLSTPAPTNQNDLMCCFAASWALGGTDEENHEDDCRRGLINHRFPHHVWGLSVQWPHRHVNPHVPLHQRV